MFFDSWNNPSLVNEKIFHFRKIFLHGFAPFLTLNTKILANLVIFWRPENLKMSKSNINQKDWVFFGFLNHRYIFIDYKWTHRHHIVVLIGILLVCSSNYVCNCALWITSYSFGFLFLLISYDVVVVCFLFIVKFLFVIFIFKK